MPTLSSLLLFASAALALLVIPGPAVTFVIAQAVHQGRRVGLASVVGLAGGSLVHVGAAAAGLSVLLVRSASLFTAVKTIGALYLIGVGVRKLLFARVADGAEATKIVSARKAAWQGFVVNVFNPKVALFFIAFLPQFVDRGRGKIAAQLVVLGLVWTMLGIVSDGAYALVGSALGNRLRSRRARLGVERTSGVLFVLLGVFALLTRRPTTATA